MRILKVTKNQGYTLCLKNTFLEKPKRGGPNRHSPAFLGLNQFFTYLGQAKISKLV